MPNSQTACFPVGVCGEDEVGARDIGGVDQIVAGAVVVLAVGVDIALVDAAAAAARVVVGGDGQAVEAGRGLADGPDDEEVLGAAGDLVLE